MKRFKFCYRNCNLLKLELAYKLLEKYRCKVIDDKVDSHSYQGIMQEETKPYTYSMSYGHTIVAEVVDCKATNESLKDLKKMLSCILGQTITFAKAM